MNTTSLEQRRIALIRWANPEKNLPCSKLETAEAHQTKLQRKAPVPRFKNYNRNLVIVTKRIQLIC
jgi:hypothetical protein